MLCMCAGTPVQNNLRELYGLMNLLDNAAYPDEAEFFANFGGDNGPPSIDQIKALQVPRPPAVLRDSISSNVQLQCCYGGCAWRWTGTGLQ